MEHKLVIATTIPKNNNGVTTAVELNGELKKVQFFKVFDPYTAYQELAMYVDEHLALDSKSIIKYRRQI
ncbi:MAG: hypothetical protein QXN55_00090 [Candidatus Nitrosotenuis sp.]